MERVGGGKERRNAGIARGKCRGRRGNLTQWAVVARLSPYSSCWSLAVTSRPSKHAIRASSRGQYERTPCLEMYLIPGRQGGAGRGRVGQTARGGCGQGRGSYDCMSVWSGGGVQEGGEETGCIASPIDKWCNESKYKRIQPENKYGQRGRKKSCGFKVSIVEVTHHLSWDMSVVVRRTRSDSVRRIQHSACRTTRRSARPGPGRPAWRPLPGPCRCLYHLPRPSSRRPPTRPSRLYRRECRRRRRWPTSGWRRG